MLELQQVLDDRADARARRAVEALAQVVDLLDQRLQVELRIAPGP
jgi:hypothetical protein